MKIQRETLKALVKESLRELIAEGALNHVFASQLGAVKSHQPPQQRQPVNPAVRAVAGQLGKNKAEKQMFEAILQDTAMTTAQEQAANEVPGYGGAGYDNNYYQPQTNDLAYQQHQEYLQSQQNNGITYAGNGQQGQYPTVMNDGYQRGGYQPPSQPAAPQQTDHRFATNWARLAFNSPINNRPQNAGSSNFLPGMKQD